LPSPKLTQEEKAQVDSKKDPAAAKWKYHNISVVRDFLPIPEKVNPYLSIEKRWELHTHLTQIADEYT
jgi:hypothetical protein